MARGRTALLDPISDPTSPAYFNANIGDRVLFAVDQSTLSAGAQDVLAGQAQWLMANGEYTALIEGHADEQGTQAYNLALGARRASAVQNYSDFPRGCTGPICARSAMARNARSRSVRPNPAIPRTAAR